MRNAKNNDFFNEIVGQQLPPRLHWDWRQPVSALPSLMLDMLFLLRNNLYQADAAMVSYQIIAFLVDGQRQCKLDHFARVIFNTFAQQLLPTLELCSISYGGRIGHT